MSDGGFPTVVGTYQLKGTAYFQEELISSATYRFQILATDPITKLPVPTADWAVYPNPCQQFLNIKLPANTSIQNIQVVNASGQTRAVLPTAVSVIDQLLSINFTDMALPTGVYFLKLQQDNAPWQTFKIIKQ